MTVDLSQYVGQEVEVTYEDGSHEVGKVEKNKLDATRSQLCYAFHPDKGHRTVYTKDGFYWSAKTQNSRNITQIKPLTMKKYEQLEQQIEDIKKEVERLKAEEETSKFPHIFNRNQAIKFLEGFKHEDISCAFSWGSTPQGSRYWSKLYYDLVNNVVQKAPDEAIMIIQSWIIQSYKNEYGV